MSLLIIGFSFIRTPVVAAVIAVVDAVVSGSGGGYDTNNYGGGGCGEGDGYTLNMTLLSLCLLPMLVLLNARALHIVNFSDSSCAYINYIYNKWLWFVW